MSLREAVDIGAAILVSLGASGVIVVALSSWLGKVWATRMMQAEQAKHAIALEKLRSELNQQTTSELELLKRKLDVLTTSHLREIQEKVEIYRMVVDIVANILADFDRIAISKTVGDDSVEKFHIFNRERMKAYGYMAMLAPQVVMDAFDAITDHLLMIAHGTVKYEWPVIRNLAISLVNEIRKDIGLDKTPIEYRGIL